MRQTLAALRGESRRMWQCTCTAFLLLSPADLHAAGAPKLLLPFCSPLGVALQSAILSQGQWKWCVVPPIACSLPCPLLAGNRHWKEELMCCHNCPQLMQAQVDTQIHFSLCCRAVGRWAQLGDSSSNTQASPFGTCP